MSIHVFALLKERKSPSPMPTISPYKYTTGILLPVCDLPTV
ncbi:hypothetical protein [Nostoc sp.]